MKILFFIDEFPKLSETFILDQLVAFIENGDEVSILSLHRSSETKINEKVIQYKLLEKTFYYHSNIHQNQLYRSALRTFFKLLLSSPSLALKSVNFLKYGRTIKSLRAIFAIQKMGQKDVQKSYDVVISHYGSNGILAAILSDCNLLTGKLVTFFHGYDMSSYFKWNGENCYDFLLKKGDLLLPISDFWRNKLISLGGDPDKIVTHHMGVNPALFDFQPEALNHSKIKLLSVARLVEKKGIRYAILATEILVKRGFNIEYKVIGGGPLYEELSELIEEKNLFKHVLLGNEASHDEVIRELKNTDLFLLPSITSADQDMEGIPVAIMEAMAVGKIVVSTRHSGIPELVEDGVTGFLADERDAEGLATAITSILNLNGTQLINIQRNARQKVEESFNAQTLNKQLISLIRQILPNGLKR